ncbi:MAG: NADH-quinone oxidoreductase subunit L [Candidatus Zixiibacteriota bacterium]
MHETAHSFILDNAYWIALLPLISSAIILFFTRWREPLSAGISITAIVLGWVASIWVMIEVLINSHGGHFQYIERAFDIVSFETMHLQLGFVIDPVAAMMLIVVTTVSSCVQIYSLGYMHGDPRFSRYYAYLSLFTFSMLGLVLANNFFLIFIFWELVGLTSYLLIGFWFEKKSASDAGKKAFITTKVGDLGFLLGLMLMFAWIGTFDYDEVFAAVKSGQIETWKLTTIGICIFCGAVGKSAQFPLHVWLPDAMEGPTPVSALIHAATMVAAGVYLVAKAMPLYTASTTAAAVVAYIGLFTSFFAASIALVQNDIKRVLAFSTLSQLGYMIMALGLNGILSEHVEPGTGYAAGTFHLMTHAFFKALLFLGAGSVIHAVHTNDIQLMGGLYGKMKKTASTFFIACLAIAGIFPFAGFFSKDEIIVATMGHPVFQTVASLVAFMTAFYMFRLYFLTFTGEPRDEEKYHHAHESPNSMTYPLMFLAVLAFGAGWFGAPGVKGFSNYIFEYGGHAHTPSAHWSVIIISTVLALCGIGLAYLMYYKKSISPDTVVEKVKPIYTLLYNKYYIDELYDFILIQPTYRLGRFLWSFDANVVDGLVNLQATITYWLSDVKHWIDKNIVDGTVNGFGLFCDAASGAFRKMQSGRLAHYLLAVVFGMILIILLASSNLLNWTLAKVGL